MDLDLSLYAAAFGGLILLALSSESLIRGGLSFAERFGLSPLLAGIFIIGFGTSLPELSISLGAAIEGRAGMAIGNLVGSNIANIWLVMASVAFVFTLQPGHFGQRRSMIALLFGTAAWIALSATGQFNVWAGIALIVTFLVFTVTITVQTHSAHDAGRDVGFVDEASTHLPLLQTFALTLCGLVGLPLSAALIIDGGIGIAREFEVSEEYIGLTLFAIGTSLPELGVSFVAAFRRQGDIVIGNVLGSNLFNLLGIGGLIALFAGLEFAPVFANYDHWVLGLATLTLALFILPRAKVTRLAALALLLSYAVYLYGLINGWNILAQVKAIL
ncbi:MAG: sodium:calcium antiporter [Pseudomonadota bacterium]